MMEEGYTFVLIDAGKGKILGCRAGIPG